MGMTAENIAEKRCYTVKEVQEMLGISRPTVYEMLHSKGNSGNSWDQQTYSVRAFKEK